MTIKYSVGVDIGGTFTDVVCAGSDGSFRLMKRATTRGDPAAAVRDALRAMRADWGIDPALIERFVHGSTVATNAVIERKGARTGIVTTAGFKDVLEIGRQMRRRMYDLVLTPETPVFLAPGARRKEVAERIAADGAIVAPLAEDEVRARAAELVADDVDSIAIVFLFSFVNPAHERRARDIIAAAHPNLAVSLSSEVDPAFREYERTAVTAFDAYLKPVVASYVARMGHDLASAGVPAPLQIMQSRGGIAAAATAAERPVRLFLSGPAAGIVGGVAAGRDAGSATSSPSISAAPAATSRWSRAANRWCAPRVSSTASPCACRWSTSPRSAPAAAASPGSTTPARFASGRNRPGRSRGRPAMEAAGRKRP
jgi:N-methylhydantoinase A/oxoprolinase/acetone carboxylase beta subunit